MTNHHPSPTAPMVADAKLRWGLYALLIAVAVGQWSGRVLAVNSVDLIRVEGYRINQRVQDYREELELGGLPPHEIDALAEEKRAELQQKLALQRPFLSANDRSRWVAVRALVERGTFAIDGLVDEPGWDTIDKVRHKDARGDYHYYSSKPPLSYLPLAGGYWAVNKLTGWTLAEQPYAVGRTLLFFHNVVPFALLLALTAAVAERLCQADWAKLLLLATAAFGTMLSAFVVTINNHLVAAVAAGAALYCWTVIRVDRDTRGGWFALAGLAAAFTAANELPALAFLAGVGLSLLLIDARRTLMFFAPAAALVAVAFFVSNYVPHNSLRPPYMHRSEENLEDNWYHYPNSHWDNRTGIDVGEGSRATYALHCLIGHHGVFSLTPIWLMSLAGGVAWLAWGQGARRELALGVLGLSVVVLVFYIGLRPQVDRNYGGMTNGLRWLFWMAPLWIAILAPAADWAAHKRWRQALALVLLAFGCLSAAYPTWNPWTQPWLYQWMEWCGLTLIV